MDASEVIKDKMKNVRSWAVAACLLNAIICLFSLAAYSRNGLSPDSGSLNEIPKQVEGIGIDENLGASVNLDMKLQDELGHSVKLQDYVKDGKPLVLSLAYYSCANLCNFHLNGLVSMFKKLDPSVMDDFHFVVVSIDARETPVIAQAKKETYLHTYGRVTGTSGWHFLVADQPVITELAKSVGFKYRWDEGQKEWAHASAAYVVTPQGQISRYLYGIDFDPKTVRLSIVEASNGKVGTLVDKLILYCFHFDPIANKYTLFAMKAMRAGGALAVIIMAAFLLPFWIRHRREKQSVQGEV
jgi:protein SCO1/2